MGAGGSRNGREPAPPAEGGNRRPARPAGAVATAGPDRPVTCPAASIQEAESLHAALADARSRTARLIAGAAAAAQAVAARPGDPQVARRAEAPGRRRLRRDRSHGGPASRRECPT
jgi:hypothetical protein